MQPFTTKPDVGSSPHLLNLSQHSLWVRPLRRTLQHVPRHLMKQSSNPLSPVGPSEALLQAAVAASAGPPAAAQYEHC